jgi:hypothetical protein
MTGLPDLNYPAFMKAAKALRKAGYKVVNPAELDGDEPCSTWVECLRRDLRWLTICQGIATLPGWKKSKGAKLEIHVGRELGMPVKSLQAFLKRRHHV